MGKELNETAQVARGLGPDPFQGSLASARRPEDPLEPVRYAPSEPLNLRQNDVHVWSFCLDVPVASLTRFHGILSPDELERAQRFHFEKHRKRYIAGRGWLRTLLGGYLGIPPEGITFAYGEYGKPELLGKCGNQEIHFNLTHSDSIACAAVTRAGAVGLDIEHVRPLTDMGELVNRFFSPRESSLFEMLNRNEQPGAFFNLWTRKEAWLKATGEGISQYLKQVEVSFLPGETPQLLELPERFQRACEWSLHALNPGPGLKGALAIAVRGTSIAHWHWSEFRAAS